MFGWPSFRDSIQSSTSQRNDLDQQVSSRGRTTCSRDSRARSSWPESGRATCGTRERSHRKGQIQRGPNQSYRIHSPTTPALRNRAFPLRRICCFSSYRFVQEKALDALISGRKYEFDTLFAFSVDLAFELSEHETKASIMPLHVLKTSACATYQNWGETLFLWAMESANPIQKRGLLQGAVDKIRAAITQATESLGVLKTGASDSAAKKYEIAATRWAAEVDPDAEAMQLQRTEPLISCATLMRGIGLDGSSVFELGSDDEIVAALQRSSSISSLDSFSTRSGASSSATSGTTTPQLFEEEDEEMFQVELPPHPAELRARGTRGSSSTAAQRPFPLTKSRSNVSEHEKKYLEPFHPPGSTPSDQGFSLSSSLPSRTIEMPRPMKFQQVPSLARPVPFFRNAVNAGPISPTSSSGASSISDFKVSRVASLDPGGAGSNTSTSPKRAPFRRSKTKPEGLEGSGSGSSGSASPTAPMPAAMTSSVRLFAAGSANRTSQGTELPVPSSSAPSSRGMQFVREQSAALDLSGIASTRFSGRAGVSATSLMSRPIDFGYSSENPTPVSSPEESPMSSGRNTPESARIHFTEVAGGLSTDVLAAAVHRLSREGSLSSIGHAGGRLSRSSSQNSIGGPKAAAPGSLRRTHPGFARLSRAGSLNAIDVGTTIRSNLTSPRSETSFGPTSAAASSARLNRTHSEISNNEALFAVRSFVAVGLKLAQALYELSRVAQPQRTPKDDEEVKASLKEASILCWRIKRLLDALPELKMMLVNADQFGSVETDASLSLKLPNTSFSSFFSILQSLNVLHAMISSARAVEIAKPPFAETNTNFSAAACRTPLSDGLFCHALRCCDEVREAMVGVSGSHGETICFAQILDDTRGLASLHLALEASLICAVWSEEARSRYYLCRMLKKLPVIRGGASAAGLHVNYEAFSRFMKRGWFKKIAHGRREFEST